MIAAEPSSEQQREVSLVQGDIKDNLLPCIKLITDMRADTEDLKSLKRIQTRCVNLIATYHAVSKEEQDD